MKLIDFVKLSPVTQRSLLVALNPPAALPPVGCDFSETSLVEKYGTWFRVQVAFYDFIFTSAMDLCEHHCNEIIAADFAETSDPYLRMRDAAEHKYPTMAEAWDAFVAFNKDKGKEDVDHDTD